MRKLLFLFTLLFSFSATMVAGDWATDILDEASSTIKKAGNVKIGYTLSANGTSSDGYIKLKGQKFVVSVGGTTTWFDGTTMWSYIKQNEEVNVTTPTATEVAKMNPYAFLTFYKQGYTAKKGNSTKTDHEVILTGNDAKQYKQVVIRINKVSHLPSYICITSAKGNVTTINCNSLLKNQKYSDDIFKFNKKDYPNVEVVDLR